MTRRLLPYLLFLILVVLFLWRPILTGAALLPGDYLAQMQPWSTVVDPQKPAPQWNPLQWDAIAQFYPWRVFYARSMSEGHIPLWNPHQFCGTPFLANGQSAVLYPGNIVFLLFDPITAFTVFAALHLFLAASFTYLLLRELGCEVFGGIVGAVSFTFCAFMVLWLELPTFISAAVWLPMVLYLAHRAVARRSIFLGMLSGLALAMAFLAGHFQIAFYVALAAGLWWLWQLGRVRMAEGRASALLRVAVPCIAFLVTATLIAAPQVLPTLELGQNSHRVRPVTAEGYESFLRNAVPSYRLVTAFMPDFFGNPSRNDYFLGSAADYIEYGLYIGILPLMLAIIGLTLVRRQRHVAFFAGLALIAILSATGTPVNALFYYLIPGFSALGGPNRILLLYFFGIAGLAAFGADWFAERAAEIRWFRYGAASTVAVVLLTLLVSLLLTELAVAHVLANVGMPVGNHHAGLEGTWVQLWLWSVIGATLLVLRAQLQLGRHVWGALVVTVIAADLFAFGINYNPICDRSKVYPRTELTTKLKQFADTSRIAPINPKWSLYETPQAILPPNAATVYGLYDVQGYDSLYTKAYKDLSSEIQGDDSSPSENGNMVLVRRFTPEVGRLARYAIARSDLPAPTGARNVAVVDGVSIWKLGASGEQSGVKPPHATYQPFSFRFGLFLAMIGLSALTCVGVYRHQRRKRSDL